MAATSARASHSECLTSPSLAGCLYPEARENQRASEHLHIPWNRTEMPREPGDSDKQDPDRAPTGAPVGGQAAKSSTGVFWAFCFQPQ